MLASKEASVSRQGRGVHSLQDVMSFLESKQAQFKQMIKITRHIECKRTVVAHPVDCGSFLLGIRTPQHEDEAFQVAAEPMYDRVGERLPATIFVWVCLVSSHGQHGVQQQHAWWVGPQYGRLIYA